MDMDMVHPTAELQINYSSKELTCKNSSENLRRYLPFGELFVEQRSTANYYTPYKFSGKEKDEETSYSYFGARYYLSDISIWASADPMKEKYPYQSPYTYCGWNPIKIIDPDGRGEGSPYGVTTSGEIRQIGPENPNEPDQLYAINNNGTKKNVKPIVIPSGTIKKIFSGQYETEGDTKISFKGALVKGDAIAIKIAEFLYENSYVEWSRVPIGTAENEWNMITTSKHVYEEGGASKIEEALIKMGYPIRGDDHNHPSGNPYPSGFKNNSESGDKFNAEMLEKKYPEVIQRIYTKKDHKYHYYNSSGPYIEPFQCRPR